MRGRTTFVWGLVLVAVGLIGLALALAVGSGATLAGDGRSSAVGGSGGFGSSGQRIYYTGLDASGRSIPRTITGRGMMGLGMMGAVTCVDCHSEDGRGGLVGMMYGSIEIPDIRYSALTAARSEDGTTEPGWSDSEIKRAIRDGIEPDGQRLRAPMPRWAMTDGELTDMIAYLKELDAR
jgi:cytochrome c oxidase subunit 2